MPASPDVGWFPAIPQEGCAMTPITDRAGPETLIGGSSADIVYGFGADAFISGHEGADVILAGPGQ